MPGEVSRRPGFVARRDRQAHRPEDMLDYHGHGGGGRKTAHPSAERSGPRGGSEFDSSRDGSTVTLEGLPTAALDVVAPAVSDRRWSGTAEGGRRRSG